MKISVIVTAKIMSDCTSKGGEIEIGGRSYEIVHNLKSHNGVSSWTIHNIAFEHLVKKNSCEALMNNFTSPSPSPPLYSISVHNNITLFKCTKNIPYAQQTDAYFWQHKYYSYKTCKNHNFYYNYVNGAIPSDLPVPHTCQCYRKERRCDLNNGHVRCSDAIKDKPKGERAPNPNLAAGKQSRKRKKVKLLPVIIGSVLILLLSFGIFIIWRHCRSNPFFYVSSKNKSPNLEDISLSCGVSVFSYDELEDATQNFDPSRELGDGGFGAVYYGKLQDGREVAVKKLHEHNYRRVQHFINEVKILSKLRHPNLVVLYGCTSRQSRELLLVYEYVPNGTVADHLHGEQANPTLLTWPIRMSIAFETAKALAFLHASEIIHRDVKTNNILLDHNFGVKVADFGLSRLISNNVSHVSTAPQGTPGYVDPQYHQRYQLTDKSDVYSFGVVLIELISSMVAVDLNRSQDDIGLANLALNIIQRCAVNELIDPVLGSDKNPEIMSMTTAVAELAFQCLQYESEMRPTMKEVLDVLMDIQAMGGIDAYVSSTRDFQTVNVLPLSETNDAVVLLKDFQPSPLSVTGEWHSNNSASSTLSNGDRLSMKSGING